jgi:hypothetical protein
MLSAEELRLYAQQHSFFLPLSVHSESPRWNHVCSAKLEPSLAANQHLCRTRPLLEEELAAAIATLKESTTAIERHVESLEGLQLPHLFKRKPDRRERAAQDLVTSIGRKDGLEFQRLWFSVSSGYRARTMSFAASENANGLDR